MVSTLSKKGYRETRKQELLSSGMCTKCAKLPIERSRSKLFCSACLDYFSNKAKIYASKIPEVMKERRKIYYLNNKETIKEKSKLYIKSHPEIKKKSQRNYSKKNSKIISKKSGEYKRAHREKYNEHNKRWRALHPERAKIDAERRRARLEMVGGDISEKEWKSLCEKYDYKCLGCQRGDVKLTIDHIVPISKGGSNSIENAQPLCKSCNSKKHDKIIDYRPVVV